MITPVAAVAPDHTFSDSPIDAPIPLVAASTNKKVTSALALPSR